MDARENYTPADYTVFPLTRTQKSVSLIYLIRLIKHMSLSRKHYYQVQAGLSQQPSYLAYLVKMCYFEKSYCMPKSIWFFPQLTQHTRAHSINSPLLHYSQHDNSKLLHKA